MARANPQNTRTRALTRLPPSSMSLNKVDPYFHLVRRPNTRHTDGRCQTLSRRVSKQWRAPIRKNTKNRALAGLPHTAHWGRRTFAFADDKRGLRPLAKIIGHVLFETHEEETEDRRLPLFENHRPVPDHFQPCLLRSSPHSLHLKGRGNGKYQGKDPSRRKVPGGGMTVVAYVAPQLVSASLCVRDTGEIRLYSRDTSPRNGSWCACARCFCVWVIRVICAALCDTDKSMDHK